jgi:hypothetical protein
MMDKPFVDVLLDVVPEDFVDAGIWVSLISFSAMFDDIL